MALVSEDSFLRRKVGPLPMWAWMGLGLGAAVIYAVWRQNREANAKSGEILQQYELPENIDPQFTFIDQGVTNVTVPWAPPGGGRPPHRPYPPTRPPAVTPVPPGTNPPVPVPPPAPTGQWGTPIVPWKKGQTKGTPSTLWGLAELYYGNGNQWGRIWNAPQNAALKSQRGAPEKIRPGDKFWIPA